MKKTTASDKGADLGRRSFFKLGGLALASAFLMPVLGGRRMIELAGADDDKHVSEKDQMAQSLGFKKDASKVDLKKFPKRAGADGKTQFCENCMFYKGDKKEGACQIFQNKLVPAKGWCNTWSKKV